MTTSSYHPRHRGAGRRSARGLQIGFGVLITLAVAAVLAVLAQARHPNGRSLGPGLAPSSGSSASMASTGSSLAGPSIVSAAAPGQPAHPTSPGRSASSPTTYAVPRSAASSAQPSAGSPPVALSIPEIGVASPLQPLGLLGDGSLQPPSAWQRAGWYEYSARPGQPGPVVIAGHIDSTAGPAVFYRLHELQGGDRVSVRSQNGAVFVYAVDGTTSYPKSGFPDSVVYGPTAVPTLRLITCAGDFDYATKSYLDNVVVSAHLVPTGG